MSSVEIVDPASSPRSSRRRILQVLGPLGGVVLVIVLISLVSIHNYRMTRHGAISLSNDLLRSQQRYVTQEVSDYLAPASASAVLAQDLLNAPVSTGRPETFMIYARSMLANVAQVDSFFFATDEGQFWMMARRGTHDYEETHVQDDAAHHRVYQHTVTDRQGHYLYADSYPAENYDPRKRPWYQGAMALGGESGNHLYWSDPYSYQSTRQFIITASVALTMEDGHHAVFAINISLNRLTDFLDSLQVGKSGRAVIVDLDGQVIAGRNDALKLGGNFDPGKIHLDPVTEPVFTRALAVFRIRGAGPGLVEARGRSYVTIASELPFVHRHWVLLLNAPEADFADFATVARKQSILLSLLVIGLALLLAIGLIVQGQGMERLRRRIGRFREGVRSENMSLLRIASTPDLLNPDHDVPILTETLCERTGARRASIWRLLPDGTRLICEDSFERGRDAHSTGTGLTERDFGPLFETLREGHVLSVGDAGADERFRAFHQVIMRTIDARGITFQPLLQRQAPLGVIILEDPGPDEGVQHVTAMVAAIMVLRLARAPGGEETHDRPATIPHVEQQTRFDEGFLIDPGEGGADQAVPTGLYPQVPVMVVVFADPFSTLGRDAEQSLRIVTTLSERVQKIAKDAGLFSMQVVSNRLILLGGCSQEADPGAALRLADAAISIREACLTSLAQADIDPIFRIGLDVGPVMASVLGREPRVFNVWGEAIGVADLLAVSTPDGGTIQVSEQAYLGLREYFLFRPRGMFYVPTNGITRSFILAGRR